MATLKQMFDELEAEGVSVRIEHYRRLRGFHTGFVTEEEYTKDSFYKKFRMQPANSWGNAVYPQGGKTVVTLTYPSNIYSGARIASYAWCSLNDNYSKKLGTMIALGRALKQFKEAKEAYLHSNPNPVGFMKLGAYSSVPVIEDQQYGEEALDGVQ